MADAPVIQAAFARTRILHQGTQTPVRGRILVRQADGLVQIKVLEDGTAILSGYPALLWPELATQAYQLTLLLRVESPQYRLGVYEQPWILTIPPGPPFDPPPPTPPRPLLELPPLFLPAEPLELRGQVVAARNAGQPIGGAQVELTVAGAPFAATLTDSQGYYRFPPLGLTGPVRLQGAKAGYRSQSRLLRLDYTQYVQEENFRLPPL